MSLNRQLPLVQNDRYNMVPMGTIPRSTFSMPFSHKTTFDIGKLIPFRVFEVLPGDHWRGSIDIFARLGTLIFPLMDNITIETAAFFVPNRIVWANWVKMQGERNDPADSISYTTPQLTGTVGGETILGLHDYFGIPVAGQVTAGQIVSVNALPFRGYWLICKEWYRDQNLQNSSAIGTFPTGDGPDAIGAQYNVAPFQLNKTHDYFTSALPWPQKTAAISFLQGRAPVTGIGINIGAANTVSGGATVKDTLFGVTGNTSSYGATSATNQAGNPVVRVIGTTGSNTSATDIWAELNLDTTDTINSLRLAFATQQVLERDARGGTRYTEILRSHWGVTPQDSRLQRPEYIGGGRSMLQTNAIPQTTQTGLTGGSTPLGTLGATATFSDRHQFSYAATEHGFIHVLIYARPALTYQQGLNRMWTRLARFDHYMPEFANIGEQAIRQDEIYCTGTDATDQAVFGYKEAWAEYRTQMSGITGLFRSTSAGTIDPWHLAEKFASAPALNGTFIQVPSGAGSPQRRVLAAGAASAGMEIILDSAWRVNVTRCMPTYSIPGMTRL